MLGRHCFGVKLGKKLKINFELVAKALLWRQAKQNWRLRRSCGLMLVQEENLNRRRQWIHKPTTVWRCDKTAWRKVRNNLMGASVSEMLLSDEKTKEMLTLLVKASQKLKMVFWNTTPKSLPSFILNYSRNLLLLLFAILIFKN